MRGSVRRVRPSEPVRTRHDEWVKRALSLWLSELGDVEIDARIAGESRRGDVLYTERRRSAGRRRRLGVLGELARGRVLFEPFRNPPSAYELKSCVLKVIELEARASRTARRKDAPSSARAHGPMLCVITPTMSRAFASDAGALALGAGRAGLYALAPIWRTVIVVANELPEDSSTLWLRLLGRGQVQEAAVHQLLAMSGREPLRDATLELLIAWRQSLPSHLEQSDDERELTMNLEQIYERWERKVKAEGRAEGRAEGKVEALLAVLEGRGLAVTAAQRKQMLTCTSDARLDRWIRAAGTVASVKDLLSSSASRARRTSAAPRPRSKRS